MLSCAYFVPKCLTCEDFVESALINGGGDLGAGERHDIQCVGKQRRMVLVRWRRIGRPLFQEHSQRQVFNNSARERRGGAKEGQNRRVGRAVSKLFTVVVSVCIDYQ